jgi:transcriptional regulator with XRE-family HTH domain
MELIPGRKPLTAEMRESWQKAGARTRVAAARIRKNVRQDDLARGIGVSVATMRRIESGEMGPGVPIGYLLACAQVLEVPLSALIEDEWLSAAERVKLPADSRRSPNRRYVPAPPP